MPAMNVAMQRRIGTLPRTPEYVPGGRTAGYYGYGHQGFKVRPTPQFEGFFGLGTANGDGKLHYFGNGEGQANLPSVGFYGATGDELDRMYGISAQHMDSRGSDLMEITNAPEAIGEISEGFITTQTALGILAVMGIVYMMK